MIFSKLKLDLWKYLYIFSGYLSKCTKKRAWKWFWLPYRRGVSGVPCTLDCLRPFAFFWLHFMFYFRAPSCATDYYTTYYYYYYYFHSPVVASLQHNNDIRLTGYGPCHTVPRFLVQLLVTILFFRLPRLGPVTRDVWTSCCSTALVVCQFHVVVVPVSNPRRVTTARVVSSPDISTIAA